MLCCASDNSLFLFIYPLQRFACMYGNYKLIKWWGLYKFSVDSLVSYYFLFNFTLLAESVNIC